MGLKRRRKRKRRAGAKFITSPHHLHFSPGTLITIFHFSSYQ
jgi:hypothetical protein